MIDPTCALLLAFISNGKPFDHPGGLRKDWFTPMVGAYGSGPSLADLWGGLPARPVEWAEFFDGRARTMAPADCAEPFAAAGLRIGAWPDRSANQHSWSDSPDRRPRITFAPVRVTTSGRYAFIAWSAYTGPLASYFRYSILERVKGGGWSIARNGMWGGVS